MGWQPAYFLNTREKWLCDENPKKLEMATAGLSLYLKRRLASSVFSFRIKSVMVMPVSSLNLTEMRERLRKSAFATSYVVIGSER